jgi:hypothetical protein
MDPRIVVRGRIEDAYDGSCLLHLGADGVEDGCEVVNGRSERSACVSDRKGDHSYPSSIFLEGRDEGGVFLGPLREYNVAAQVHAYADTGDVKDAVFLVEGGRV